MIEKFDDDVRGVYRTHSDIDIYEIRKLMDMRAARKKPLKIDISTIWANFYQENMITLFMEDPEMFEFIHETFTNLKFEPVANEDGSSETNPQVRRLHYVIGLRNKIKTPTIVK